jgi:hypothetical protein
MRVIKIIRGRLGVHVGGVDVCPDVVDANVGPAKAFCGGQPATSIPHRIFPIVEREIATVVVGSIFHAPMILQNRRRVKPGESNKVTP